MEEWRTNIQLGAFGETCEMEFQIVRSWKSFKKLFDGAQHIDAVTYCESPDLLLELFDMEDGLQSIDVAIGNKEEYQSTVDDESLAKDLVNMYNDGKLTVRMKSSKVVHAKMYRIVKPDGVTLITGSANFSYNSWKNQANNVVIYRCSENSQLDNKFESLIQQFRDDYCDKVFLQDLVERINQVDTEEEKSDVINLWVDQRGSRLTEEGEINTKGAKEIRKVAEKAEEVYAVTDDEEKADKTVAVESVGLEGSDSANSKDEDGRDITAAKMVEEELTLSTQDYDGGYVESMETQLKRRGADVSGNRISTPIETYSNFRIETYGIPDMYLVEDETPRICLQSGSEFRDMRARYEPDETELNECLENIERYIETVEWGQTANETAVKAHMYEGILYFLWAPFANKFAEAFYGDATLDNVLQYLYIYGPSDAGKDQFTEFCLRLISDELVTSGQDGDNVGKKDIRSLRRIDTVMPFVVSDISKDSIERTGTLRNYWEEKWSPHGEVSFPSIVFTSNDSKPKEWFRNRSRMLYFDVVFPSEPEDDGFFEAQKELNEVMEEENNIFSHVSREMFRRSPWENPTGTVTYIRQIVADFYETANREKPAYFPEEESASRTYDEGKRKWSSAVERGVIEFEKVGDKLVAHFELENHELHSYEKTLPKRTRPQKQGKSIVIESPEPFVEWFGKDIEIGETEDNQTENGLFSRLPWR